MSELNGNPTLIDQPPNEQHNQINDLPSTNEHQINDNNLDAPKPKKSKKKKSKSKSNSSEQLNDLSPESNVDKMNEVNVVINADQNQENNVNIQIDTPNENEQLVDIPNNQNGQPTDTPNENEQLVDIPNNQNEQPTESTKLLESEQVQNDKQSNGNQVTVSSNDDTELTNRKQASLKGQSKGNGLAKENGASNKKNGQTEKKEEIPELLLTENNRPNSGNKLVIFLILAFKFVTYFIIKLIGLFHPAKRNQLPPINEPVLLLSAGEITKRIKNGDIKCEQVIRAYINRIKTVQPKLNAVIDDCFDEALDKAREIDENLKDPKLAEELKKKILLGVPFTCKDSIPIKGLAFTAGVKIRKGIKADEDAPVIKNLRNAGAIPLCLTNTPELVLWMDSDNNLYGRTNNPYDLSRIVGGSSGGEGCLISAGGSLMGVGSDVGGSIRIPSMFNGIFGHKTIRKYVPTEGMWPPPPESFSTFLCFGPICRYARDLPLMLKAMGSEHVNELRLDEPVDFKKIKKIYYMEDDGGNVLASFVDQRIVNSMHKALKHFEEEYGIQTEKINITKFKYGIAFFGSACRKGGMKIEDYISKSGHVNVYWELFKSLFGKSNITRPILIQIINQNSPYCDPNSPVFRKFTKMLEELKPKVHDMLSDNAVLFMPTWPTIAVKHQTTVLRGFDSSYTTIMNALEVPATHATMGLTKQEGLPLGFSIAAAPGQDRLSIAFAKEIERKFGGWVKI